MERIMRYNRIAVSGIDGISKTTLVNLIAAESAHPIVADGAREIRESVGMDWWTIDALHLARFQLEVFVRHMAAMYGKSRFVADCSILDIMAYTAYHLQRGLENSGRLQVLSLRLELAALRLSRMYDRLVFYSPEGPELTEEKSCINHLILDLLTKYAGEWETITRPQVYARFGDRILAKETADCEGVF